jgi:hypothetical protein
MPKIIVQAINADGEPRRWTLSERIVAENLESEHYAAQLMQRLAWAAADAEALESRSQGPGADSQAARGARPIRTRGDTPADRSRLRSLSRTPD